MSSPRRLASRVIPIIPVSEGPGAQAPAEQGVSLFEKQKKIYPRSVDGWFARWRWWVIGLTQAVFYGLPWLPWNGRQAVLFDLGARRFFVFDLVLYPQDFIYLTGLLVLSAFGLFFFTAVGGRLWCGFACPQTVYTHIFLWIERHTEGERGQRMRQDAGPWHPSTLFRKSAKHGLWIGLSLWTGFTFVGYFTPIHSLWAEAFTLSFGPWEWFWVDFYGLATYGNAGFLREQVCKYMCPYARFQSAMFDRDTLIVSYDAERGEPRGQRGRSTELAQAGLGHCIDCGLCVQVCPTGIDIRNGLQYECIACTACIDACNHVMDKMHYPRGLIRYATQNGLLNKMTRAQMFKRVFRPRVWVYGALLLVISAVFVASLSHRSPLKVDVVRDRASLARLVGQGQIENVYRLQMMNVTEKTQHYRVAVVGIDDAEVVQSSPEIEVGPAQARWTSLAVRIPHQSAKALGSGIHPIRFSVSSASDPSPAAAVIEKSTFVIPR